MQIQVTIEDNLRAYIIFSKILILNPFLLVIIPHEDHLLIVLPQILFHLKEIMVRNMFVKFVRNYVIRLLDVLSFVIFSIRPIKMTNLYQHCLLHMLLALDFHLHMTIQGCLTQESVIT